MGECALMMRLWIGRIFLLGLLSVAAWGQELYISNRPFAGEIVKLGSSHQVELQPLLKALKLSFPEANGQLQVKDITLPLTQSASGKTMVSLEDFVVAAGLTLRKNADFGHLDLYSSPSGASGDWGSDTAASGEPSGAKGSLAGKEYSIKVPKGFTMVDDPQLMQALVGMAAQRSGGGVAEGQLTCEFVITTEQGDPRTGAVMLMSIPLPSDYSKEAEPVLLEALVGGMKKRGRLVSGPTPAKLGSLSVHKYVVETQNDSGNKMMESYIYLGSPSRKLYWLALVDESTKANASFPTLRNIAGSFKVN